MGSHAGLYYKLYIDNIYIYEYGNKKIKQNDIRIVALRNLGESEAVSLLDISVQNITFLPPRLFQVRPHTVYHILHTVHRL
jgi:hypothetical protein